MPYDACILMSVFVVALKSFSMRNAMGPDKLEPPLSNFEKAGRELPGMLAAEGVKPKGSMTSALTTEPGCGGFSIRTIGHPYVRGSPPD